MSRRGWASVLSCLCAFLLLSGCFPGRSMFNLVGDRRDSNESGLSGGLGLSSGDRFARFQAAVERNCNGCHGGADSPFGNVTNFVVLKTETDWLNHTTLLIVKGKPEASPIYNRLTFAKGKVTNTNNNMPFGTPQFPMVMTSREADDIYNYIANLRSGGGGKILDSSSPYSGVSKAKLVAHGGAPTQGELGSSVSFDGSLNRNQLKSQILAWLNTDPGKQKIENFLKLTLDQDDWEYPNAGTPLLGRIRGQGNGRNQNSNRNAWEQNIKESFGRTAQDIIDRGLPYTQIVTTRRRMVTSAILSTLSFADGANEVAEDNQTFNNHLDGLQASDFTDWRPVTFTTGDAIAYDQMNQIRQIASEGNYQLRLPRVGFFNTLAFQLKWPTNDANSFRVTISQALLVALNQPFEAGDFTQEGNQSSLDREHAAPGTDCYLCHRLLDPARETFRMHYNDAYRFGGGAGARTPAFAFMGHTGPSANIDQMANTIANHPLFAQGWVGKYCNYANSEPCNVNSEEFQRIVNVFKSSNYNFKTMVAELLSSPLVTAKAGNGESESRAMIGSAFVSLTRQNHLCHALNTRYHEVLSSLGRNYPHNNPDVCALDGTISNAIESIANDSTDRGKPGLVQSPEVTAFAFTSYEQLCRGLAEQMVANDGSRGFDCCDQNDVSLSLDNMTRYIMGLAPNHPRYTSARQTLQSIYDYGTNQLSMSGLDSLKHAFGFACGSPDLTGMGL